MEKSKIRCAVNEVRYMEFIHITLHVGLPQAVKITLIQCTVVPSYTVREQLQNSNEQVFNLTSLFDGCLAVILATKARALASLLSLLSYSYSLSSWPIGPGGNKITPLFIL